MPAQGAGNLGEHHLLESEPSFSTPPPSLKPNPNPPKHNSRWQTTLQLIACFFLYMNAWAMPNTFGLFQAYYAETLIPDKSESQIAWIGSLQAFLLLFVAVLVGPLVDAGYLRTILLVGTGLMTFGFMMTSISHEYYQLVLSQGLVVGLGTGCLFLPSITITPQWVSLKNTGLALGVVATGSSVGGIVFPAIVNAIGTDHSFPWAVRAIGFITFATNLFAAVVLKYNKELPAQRRGLFDLSMWKSWFMPTLALALFFLMVGLYIPIFFLESFYRTQRQQGESSYPQSLTPWLIPILMAGSLPGRLIPNMLAASVMGNLNMMVLMVLLSSILAFCWIAVGQGGVAGLIVFALFYGFMSGGVVSLIPPVVVSTAPSKEKLGTRMGMLFTCASLGLLVGNPVAGAILAGNKSGSYTGVQVFAGVVMMASATLMLGAKVLKLGGVDSDQHHITAVPLSRLVNTRM